MTSSCYHNSSYNFLTYSHFAKLGLRLVSALSFLSASELALITENLLILEPTSLIDLSLIFKSKPIPEPISIDLVSVLPLTQELSLIPIAIYTKNELQKLMKICMSTQKVAHGNES